MWAQMRGGSSGTKSSPAFAGEGDQLKAGGGAFRSAIPLHRATRGPPPPVIRGRIRCLEPHLQPDEAAAVVAALAAERGAALDLERDRAAEREAGAGGDAAVRVARPARLDELVDDGRRRRLRIADGAPVALQLALRRHRGIGADR